MKLYTHPLIFTFVLKYIPALFLNSSADNNSGNGGGDGVNSGDDDPDDWLRKWLIRIGIILGCGITAYFLYKCWPGGNPGGNSSSGTGLEDIASTKKSKTIVSDVTLPTSDKKQGSLCTNLTETSKKAVPDSWKPNSWDDPFLQEVFHKAYLDSLEAQKRRK